MKLYVCWGTFPAPVRPGGHPCGNAYRALREAGHDPEVIRSYGWDKLPGFMNQTPGRKEAKRLTGKVTVPAVALSIVEVVVVEVVVKLVRPCSRRLRRWPRLGSATTEGNGWR